jgi:hypothetical protein
MLPLQNGRLFFVEFKPIVAHVSNKGGRGSSGVVPMIALLFENLKLIMLFMLIGTIIGLSHLRGEALTHMKQEK